MKLSVVTANRLRDGTILWLGAGPSWRERLTEAQPFDDESIAAALQFGALEATAQRVVGVYQVEVEHGPHGLAALSARERVRALGPSVRPDLGYATTALVER